MSDEKAKELDELLKRAGAERMNTQESETAQLRRLNRELETQLRSTQMLLSLTQREMHHRSETYSDQTVVDDLIECVREACHQGVSNKTIATVTIERWIAAIDAARGRDACSGGPD